MNIIEVSIMPHLGIVLLLLRLYSEFRSRDPIPYIISFVYLSWIHPRYVKAFWKNLELANQIPSEQREIGQQRQERRMQLKDKQVSYHLLVVLLLLWFLSALNCHWVVYFILFLYLFRVLADSEILRLLNYVTETCWPKYLKKYASEKIFQPVVDWFLEKHKPPTLKKALVQLLCLGSNPPTFTELHFFHNSDSNGGWVIELGINFSADDHMNSIVTTKLRGRLGPEMWVKLKMTNLCVDGKVLIVVNFINHRPFVRSLQLCFVKPPYFRMTVKPLSTCGLDITKPPDIVRWLDDLCSDAMKKKLVWPSTLTVDMERYAATCIENTESCFFLDIKEPVACVRVGDIKAFSLNPPWFSGSVDWYVKVRLGNRILRSRTQRTESPCWDEEYEIPVTTWESLDKIMVKVCYEGFLGDETYRWNSLDINAVRDGRSHSRRLPLGNNMRQFLHLSVAGHLHLSVAVLEGNVRALSSVPRV